MIEVETDHPVDSHTLDFGEVYAGETREKEVTITNIGDDTLQIQDLVLSNTASFEIVNDGEYDVLLAPNSSTVVLVSYSPVQDEHIEGTLIVASNDRESPEIPVRLLAEGLAPAVDIQPPSFDFGNFELGCVNQVEITIANVGRAPLVVDEIFYDDLAGTGELTLANNNGETFTLDPNEATTVVVHYVPTDVEPDSGILHVVTNTPAEPVDGATAQQFGIAHLGENNIDQYMQEGNNSTDILFTVDNSCSMGQEQTALAVNFAAFLQIIQALDIDYHLGVTSTDVGDNGTLLVRCRSSRPLRRIPPVNSARTSTSASTDRRPSRASTRPTSPSTLPTTEQAMSVSSERTPVSVSSSSLMSRSRVETSWAGVSATTSAISRA